MKFIRTKDRFLVFGNDIFHSYAADKTVGREAVVSAGMFDPSTMRCSGESDSLGLSSRADDSEFARKTGAELVRL